MEPEPEQVARVDVVTRSINGLKPHCKSAVGCENNGGFGEVVCWNLGPSRTALKYSRKRQRLCTFRR